MNTIFQQLRALDFWVVAAYLVILTGIGWYVSFAKSTQQSSSLFLAGRSLSWPSIGFTMWGTNVGPSMLIASASIGYTTGIVAGNFAWYAFPFIFLLATVFAPRYLGANVQTLPEYMGKRFGQRTRGILAWYSIATILISWLALTLYSGGILVSQIFDISLLASVLALVAISAFFAMAGGLKAIAVTNTFQMIMLIVVSGILAWKSVEAVGGPMALFESTPGSYWNLLYPADDANYPWVAIALGYPVMGVWFWCTDQSMVQSVLGAKTLKQGQLGANFCGWLKIFDVALFIIPGIACFVLFPTLDNPDEAYMTMVSQLMPAGLRGLVMAALIAALISTIDSALNSLSTVFTMDIYVKNYKPDATQEEIKTKGRWVVLGGGLIAVCIAMAIDSIKGLNLFDTFQAVLGFISPPMAALFLLGVFWKGATTRAANFILSAGTIFSFGVGILYLWVFPKDQYPWPHFLLLSFYIFLVLMIAATIVSIIKPEQKNVETVAVDLGWKWSYNTALAWGTLAVVMIGFYFLFNGH